MVCWRELMKYTSETIGNPGMNLRNRQERLAYIISGAIHPVVLLIVSMTAVGIYARANIRAALADTGIFFAGILPGWAYHFSALHRRRTLDYTRITNYHRYTLIALLLGLGFVFAIYRWIGVPTLQVRSLTVILLAIVGCLLINRFWKISFHAAIAMICAALFVPIAPLVAVFLTVLGIIAGLSRLLLELHTPTQVVAGWLYGFCSTSVLLLLLH
jgi:membrane-associated phospholipid phosphatase